MIQNFGDLILRSTEYHDGRLPDSALFHRKSSNSSGQMFYLEAGGRRDWISSLANFSDRGDLVEAFESYADLMPENIQKQEPSVFIGFDRLEYAPHADVVAHFLAQVQGFKRVLLFSPFKQRFLNFEENRYSPWRRQCHVDVVLRPGNVLYIPPLFPHYAEVDHSSTQGGSPFWLTVSQFMSLPDRDRCHRPNS